MLVNQNSIAGKIQGKMDDKGSIGNRIEYAGKEMVNFRKYIAASNIATTAGLAASIGGAAAIAKSKTAQTKLAEIGKKIANNESVKKLTNEVTPYVKKAAGWVQALPKPAKAVLAIGTALTVAAGNVIGAKANYKAGKIDQEYTDKAKLNNLLG